MTKSILPITLLPITLLLAACGSEAEPAAEATEVAALAAPAAAAGDSWQIEIDFGDDNGDWANDNECDDSRFEGPGMTTTILLDEDIGHDATDCRTAYEAGRLTLRAVSTQ